MSVQNIMMLANSPPLAAEEQALSNSISQLAANVFQDIQALRALDVAVQSIVLQGLTAKVQDQLRHYRSLLSDLQHAAEEQETPDQTQRVANVLAKHQTDYDSIHKAFQEARISYTRRKEQSYVQQRQELIGSVDFSQRQQQFASEHEAEQRAQDVTASLRRTRQLMAQNLEQTHGNISVIASGNKRVQEAGDELSGQKDLFKDSHGLLSTLKTQNLMDRFVVWGGFTFFVLVVLYISFRRTPAFMKQPLYALLHMKHGGKPFDHHDYASVNIPPGTFTPSDKSWPPGVAFEGEPSSWSAWDAHYAEGSEHGQDPQDVLVDGQWRAQDLLNEGLQQGSAGDWQGSPGSLRDRLRMQQQQQDVPPEKQQPWQQQQHQHVEEPGTPMQRQEQPVRDQCAADDSACHAASGQQQQPHEDVDEVAFHSDDQHQGLHDHEELEYLQQQQQQHQDQQQQQQHPDQQQQQQHHDQQQQQQHQDQQQQQQPDHLQQQEQERVLQEQQELDRSLQQQEQQRLAARESAAARVAAEAAELKAALRAQQQPPQVDTTKTASEGAAVEHQAAHAAPEDQAAHAAPPVEPAATQQGSTTNAPSAEATQAALVEEPAAAAAHEQPPGFEPRAVDDLHKPVSAEQPAAAPGREHPLEVPLGTAAQQVDTLVQEAPPVDAAQISHADQQTTAAEAPPSGHGDEAGPADQHALADEHSVADAGHVSQQQPDMVPQLDMPDSAGAQQRHLSADATVHRGPEVHDGQPAAAGTGAISEQPPSAAVGQPSMSEAPVEGHLQAGGAGEQEPPRVHAVEQPVEPAAAEAPTAVPSDAMLETPGTPAAAARTLEHADEQQRQLQADHQQQQQLLQPTDAPAAAEALSTEQEQQSRHVGAAAPADSLGAAPAPAPAAVAGDLAHELKQPENEAVQLGGPHLQQQQSQEPLTAAAPTPVPAPAPEQHSDQQMEAVVPESISTHAAPAVVQASGSTAPEVAAPVDATGEVVSSTEQQQQHVVEPQQPDSTFDNEAKLVNQTPELVHQAPAPSGHEAPVKDGTGPAESVDAVSIEPTDHHRLEVQHAEAPAVPVGNAEQPLAASAHQGDLQQGTAPDPKKEEPPEYEQGQRQHQQHDQQLEVESVQLGQAKEQQLELVDQTGAVGTEQHPQQQQQKASGPVQDAPAQAPAIADQVPEHHHHQQQQQQQQAASQQHPDAVAVPKPAASVAAPPVQTVAPVAGAAESAQRTAATISTAAEDVVGAAVEAVSVAEQVQKAVSNTGKSFGAKVLSRWGGHSGLAAIGGTKAVKQQAAAAGAAAAAVRRGGGSSFIPAAAAAEIPAPAPPHEGPATYAGLDYYADDMSSEQPAVEADTAAAPATTSQDDTQHRRTINPDNLSAAELDQLSKQIEEEQQKAFTIMDMGDVGLYQYDEQGNAVLRDGLSSAARQGGDSGSSGAAAEHVEL